MEAIISDSDYKVIYEKGNFQSGYCILENRNIVVINKFLDLQGKINVFVDLLGSLSIDTDNLSEELKTFFENTIQKNIKFNKESKMEIEVS